MLRLVAVAGLLSLGSGLRKNSRRKSKGESRVQNIVFSDCLSNAASWLPDDGVALCNAGRFQEAEGSVSCVKHAYHPFYRRGEGLNWSKPQSVEQAFTLCTHYENDADNATLAAECTVRTWWLGDEAKAGCTANHDHDISKYMACFANAEGWLPDEGVALCTAGRFQEALEQAVCFSKAKSWLPDDGVALCSAGRFQEAEGSVSCIKQAYEPFYSLDGGLNWRKSLSVEQALTLCTHYENDAENATLAAERMVATCKLGDTAKAKWWFQRQGWFRRQPGHLQVNLCRYMACFSKAQGWLPDGGEALCSAGRFQEAEGLVSCVEKAYEPFYRVYRGLNLGLHHSLEQALPLCTHYENDADNATLAAECMVLNWKLGDEAKASCIRQ